MSTIEPEGIGSVINGEWEEFELAVDSGASETVIPETMIVTAEVIEGPASKRGVEYEVANGIRIPNLGEKRFTGFSQEGVGRRLIAQVCDVNKGLLSVSKITRSGHRVVFDANGSYIEHEQTGESMYLTERNGMYMLKL